MLAPHSWGGREKGIAVSAIHWLREKGGVCQDGCGCLMCDGPKDPGAASDCPSAGGEKKKGGEGALWLGRKARGCALFRTILEEKGERRNAKTTREKKEGQRLQAIEPGQKKKSVNSGSRVGSGGNAPLDRSGESKEKKERAILSFIRQNRCAFFAVGGGGEESRTQFAHDLSAREEGR